MESEFDIKNINGNNQKLALFIYLFTPKVNIYYAACAMNLALGYRAM